MPAPSLFTRMPCDLRPRSLLPIRPHRVVLALAMVASLPFTLGANDCNTVQRPFYGAGDEFSASDSNADWGETCSNGSFDGMEGPPEMDIAQIDVEAVPDGDGFHESARIVVTFNGDNAAYISQASPKPFISLQLMLKDGTFIEVFLQDDCTWKTVRDGTPARVHWENGGTGIVFELDGFHTNAIDSVEVESANYDVFGTTFCDHAEAFNPDPD